MNTGSLIAVADWETFAVSARMLERLIVVCVAGMSIYLGYKLFMQMPDLDKASGKVKFNSVVDMTFSKVGPGVFFAAFGAAVLMYSFYRPISLGGLNTSAGSSSAPNNPSPNFVGSGASESEQDLALNRAVVMHSVASINQLDAELTRLGRVPPNESNTLRDTKVVLMELVWDPKWGDRATFKAAVDKGSNAAGSALPKQTRDAIAIFSTLEDK